MLVGCWRSDAFLAISVLMLFTAKISTRMIQHQHFFSVPSINLRLLKPQIANPAGQDFRLWLFYNGEARQAFYQSIFPVLLFNILMTKC
jgi:hypothetical protein